MDLPRASAHDLGGTIRACRPEETLLRVRPMLRRFGITRVSRITGLDHIGIPVSVAVRPEGRLLATAQGKGVTPELADLSAIMESIETWHAENLPPADVIGAARDLRKELPLIELAGLPTARGPIEEHIALDWLWGQELFGGSRVLLPRGCFDLDTTQPGREGRGLLFAPVTTGLASGNTRTEAILHGVYEAIERDAHARFDSLGDAAKQTRRIDPSSVEESTNRQLIDRIAAAGLRLDVFDMTSQIGVPACYAELRHEAGGVRSFADEGMGAHLRPEIALSRAITEAVQSRLAYISGTRDDIYPHVYRQDRLRQDLAMAPAAQPGGIDWQVCARPPFVLSLEENLQTVLQLLSAVGFSRLYALDLTRADVEIPVVYVLCPGLRDRFREPLTTARRTS